MKQTQSSTPRQGPFAQSWQSVLPFWLWRRCIPRGDTPTKWECIKHRKIKTRKLQHYLIYSHFTPNWRTLLQTRFSEIEEQRNFSHWDVHAKLLLTRFGSAPRQPGSMGFVSYWSHLVDHPSTIYIYICVCVCVCARTRISKSYIQFSYLFDFGVLNCISMSFYICLFTYPLLCLLIILACIQYLCMWFSACPWM